MLKLNNIYRYVLSIGQTPLKTMLAHCESPIEEIFLIAAYEPLTNLGLFCAQYKTLGGRYRPDFALLGRNWKIAIECDGREFHSDEDQLSAAGRRDIDLQCDGWNVAHFRGKVINGDALGCVAQVERLARAARVK